MSCALAGADARGRHHHGNHFDMHLQALPGADTPSTQRQSTRRGGRERSAVVAPTDHLPAERSIDTAQIVPRAWKLESPTQTATGNVLYRRMGWLGSSGTTPSFHEPPFYAGFLPCLYPGGPVFVSNLFRFVLTLRSAPSASSG